MPGNPALLQTVLTILARGLSVAVVCLLAAALALV